MKFAFDSQVWIQYYSVDVNPPFLSILVQRHLSLAFLNWRAKKNIDFELLDQTFFFFLILNVT